MAPAVLYRLGEPNANVAMVQLILRLTAVAGRAHELVHALQPHVRRALHTDGCRTAYLAADVEEAGVFWYCEDWDDTRALESKVRTAQFADLLELMEISGKPPQLEFRIVEEVKGLEYVAVLRGRTERDSRRNHDEEK